MSRGLAFFSIAMLLSGCMQGMTGDGSLSERLSSARLGIASEQNENTTTPEPSAIILSLQSRSSAIRPGTAYATIAAATLASDARVAEAELRAARLRSAATDKNWMPSIGPAISLTSLGDMVANLVVEAVIFDNGKKKAERAMARAEVEVAAVSLVSDGNERVYEALDLYLTALEGGESQRLSREALLDMRRFRWIMNERVKGGVSDMSDLTILAQKIAEIESSMKDAQDKRDTALAELSAMTDRDLSDLTGIGALDMSAGNIETLGVVAAKVQSKRDQAAADMERAGNLPSIVASASGGSNDVVGGIRTEGLFDFGRKDRNQALDAEEEALARRVKEAEESSQRKIRSYEAKLTAAQRAYQEAVRLSKQAKSNLDLFQSQYEAGQRQVMDVVGVYETFARQQHTMNTQRFLAAKYEVLIAREYGVLVAGKQL
jgi:adhesin transport system outer membrane protein